MTPEARENGEKARESLDIREQPPRVQAREQTLESSGEDVALKVEQQRKAAEHAARASGEMKDALLVRVESLLSEGLAGEYAKLSSEKKPIFKEEGEELALWLHGAITQGTVKPHKVLERIEKWLLIIEERKRFEPWLVQEAYIRARRALRSIQVEEVGH